MSRGSQVRRGWGRSGGRGGASAEDPSGAYGNGDARVRRDLGDRSDDGRDRSDDRVAHARGPRDGRDRGEARRDGGSDGRVRSDTGRVRGDEGLVRSDERVARSDEGQVRSRAGRTRSGEGQSDDSRVPTTEHHRSRTTRASRNGVTTNGAPPVATDEERGGLSPAQLRRIEQRLLHEREMALRTLLGTRTDIQRHPIADMRKEEMDIHLAERHSEFIGLIDAALRRLRESPEDFHLSVVSGEPIPFERLEMVPWTRRLTSEMGLPTR